MRLTTAAVDQIRRLAAGADRLGSGLRITLQPGGCCGQFLYMYLGSRQEGDVVVEQGGATVLVDPALAPLLEGAILDYGDRLRPPRFRLKNIRIPHKCACGRSIGSPYRGKSKQCRAYEPPPWLSSERP